VDCVVFGFDFEKLNILLIEQKSTDNLKKRSRFALPGDLVHMHEDLDEAAKRVLFELTNLKDIYLKQFKAFGNPHRLEKPEDQYWLKKLRENPNERVITVAYYSLVKMDDYDPTPASFAQNAQWVAIDEVPSLAFDHNHIFEEALYTLRREVEVADAGYELLPDKFTLSQLQTLYEVILDRKLDKRNFRKKMKKIDTVVPLNERQMGVYHKPAQLYTYDKG
jgi:8-oxo-dGTP diphosphatase